MSIQKCKNCSNEFTYSEILGSILGGYKVLECTKCHTKYKITILSRLIVAVVLTVPILLINHYLRYHVSEYSMLIYFCSVILSICLSPFFAIFDYDEEE